MSLLNLALAYVWHRRLVTLLTALSVALGVASILVVLNIRRQLERTFLEQGQSYDLIVGPVGSETALVMTALFHADQPRGNIPFDTYEKIKGQSGVLAAYPFSLGDQYRGAPIVGTTADFLEQQTANAAPLFPLAEGNLFSNDLEAVAGAEAARRLSLTVGSQFSGSHATSDAFFEHREFPYTVVGVLEPTGTPQDRAIFTPLESYWRIHNSSRPPGAVDAVAAERADPRLAGKEVTVLLLRTVKPLVFQLQQLLPQKFQVMAVRPASVLQNVFTQVLQPIERILLLYGYSIVLVAALSVATTLYLSTLARRKDIGILRALGARPREVFTVVLFEALILVTVGCAMGVLLSQAAAVGLRTDLEGRFGLDLQPFLFTPAEVYAIGAVFLVGTFAALLPAGQAYRSEIAGSLGRG